MPYVERMDEYSVDDDPGDAENVDDRASMLTTCTAEAG